MNPLLNRIFEKKSKTLSKQANNINSSLQKTLIPKINAKKKLQSLNLIKPSIVNNTVIIKPQYEKLKILFTQNKDEMLNNTDKKIQSNKSRVGFRSRRLSAHIKQKQTSLYFPTELNLQQSDDTKRQQKPIIKSQKIIQKSVKLYNQKIKQKQKQEDQLFQYLSILENNRDLKEQFCYMNRHKEPYSYYIVDYHTKHQKEYLTVSLRGITSVNDGENQFFTIKQFSKSIYLYNIIKKISFFQKYLQKKIINHWKQKMLNKKFANQCNFIKQNLLSQDLIKQKYLFNLHNLYQDFCKDNFFSFSVHQTTNSLKQFQNQYLQIKRKQIQKNFTFFEQQIKQMLIECNKESMDKFKKLKRLNIGQNKHIKNSQTFLPYDNKKKSMKYTQLAKIKQFQQILYKLIKYTDLIRFNLRVQFTINSLQQSIKQMQILYKNYQDRNKRSFISWIQCKVIISQKQELKNQVINQSSQSNKLQLYNYQQKKNQSQQNTIDFQIKLSPSIQQIYKFMIDHKNQCMKILWANYSQLIQNKHQFSCVQIQMNGQIPSNNQLKYFMQKNIQINQINEKFKQSFLKMIKQINHYISYLDQNLLKIYKQSFLTKQIQIYLENQVLKSYLINYTKGKRIFQQCEQQIQFGLILLKMNQFKNQVKKKYQQRYKIIINAIPIQVLKRTKQLAKQIQNIYHQFKQNPSTVRQYIDFTKKFKQNQKKLSIIENKIDNLKQLEQMIINNGIKISDISKMKISQSQIMFRQLQKRFQEIQQNQQKQRKKFQLIIQNFIPDIEQKSQNLLKQLNQNQILKSYQSLTQKVNQQIQKFDYFFQKVKQKKDELFIYQKQLQMGHKDLQNFFKLDIQFEWFKNIWKGHSQYVNLLQITKQKGYGQVQNINISILRIHLQNIQKAAMDIQALQLLQQFKTQTTKLLHIIQLCHLISSNTLQPQHFSMIKKLIKFKQKQIKDTIFTRQGSRNISCYNLYTKTNISQIENQLSQIVFLSAQESIITKQLNEIQQYWKKNKIAFIYQDISNSQIKILHLHQNQQLLQKIGLFTLTLKNIQNSSHAKGILRQKLQIQIKITFYLRKLLLFWSQVQCQWLKLIPMMTNCPSVKHQSNVFFEFSSVDSTMKKLIKQVSQMQSMKKLIQDYEQTKNIQILQNCKFQLDHIDRTLKFFLQNKRTTYNRFYFLTDEQLISIIQNVKDSRSFSKYGILCFNCNQINLQNQLLSSFVCPNQTFKLRKSILRGQPDEIFKAVSENMKISLKSTVRLMIPKMKISLNIQQQLKQCSLQTCLIADYIIWTQMTQTYLNTVSYDQYQLVIKQNYQQMLRALIKADKYNLIKISIRLVQAMNLKNIAEELVNNQLTNQDFKWKQQIKFVFEDDQINVCQFNHKIVHGLEYYPPEKIIIPTLNTQKFQQETYYTCLNQKILFVNGYQGQGKKYLIKNSASFLGIYQKDLFCNKNLKFNYLMRFVQGAILAGAWISFYQYTNINKSILYQLYDNIQKLKNQQKFHPRAMFLFVNHKQQYGNTGPLKYNNYSVVEPDHKKICQYLLQMYRFRQSQQLSNKIISFLKTIKPFIGNIMGSSMRVIRKIVDGAGNRKINENENNQILIVVEVIYKQILQKIQQNLYELIKQALLAHFNIQLTKINDKLKYHQKKKLLNDLILKQDTSNIIIIGNRSCKTNLINETISQLKHLQIERIFPQAHSSYFTTYSIDYLNNLSNNKIVLYDGNNIISEFNDLITSGQLMIQGKKLQIKQKVIMELRNINNCTPSFIENCDIIYVGNLISKLQKFKRYCPIQNNSQLFYILIQIFGEQLQKLQDFYIQILAKFIYRYKDISQSRTIHKIIIWLFSVLQDPHIWNKNYGGINTDFCVHQKYLELVQIDPHRSNTINQQRTPFFYVPTKSTILITELSNYLMKCNLNVQIFGGKSYGKSTIIKLLKGIKINLKIQHKTQQWSSNLKKKLLFVRKQGKNFLIPVSDKNYCIIIDDLDLGNTINYQYTRSVIQYHQIRNSKYQIQHLQNFNILTTSRSKLFNSKLDDHLVKIPLHQLSKQSFSTIYSVNVQNFVKSHNMNRQVVDYVQKNILKIVNVIYDDLGRLYTQSVAAGQLILLLKNIISLPKRNSYILLQDFKSYFKSLLFQKLTQKAFQKKIKWQLTNIYENIIKIFFNNQPKCQYWFNSDSSYKKIEYDEISNLIKQKYPQTIIYKSMIQNILYINNQLNSINPHVIMIGRRGVGKKQLVRLIASLNKINIVQSINQLIFNVLNNQQCILMQDIKPNELTFIQKLNLCQMDEDLQQFLQLQQKQKFRKSLVTNKSIDSTQIILKIKKFIKNILLLQDKQQLDRITHNYRKFIQFSVCIVEQWPSQAIVQVYKTSDGNQKLHANIFSTINGLLNKNQISSMNMAKYQKYIQIYSNIFQSKMRFLQQKKQNLTVFYDKFSQSCSIIKHWQSKISTLQSQINYSIKQLSDVILGSKLNTFAAFVLAKHLSQRQQQTIRKKQQLQKSKLQMQIQLKKNKKVLQKIQVIISSLHRSEMSEMKKIYRNNNLVQFGLQCLCILFKQEISQKSINKLLADPNLLMKMKSNEILLKKNIQLCNKFKNQIVQFDSVIKTNTTQISKVLIEWIRSIIQYWQTNQLYAVKINIFKNLSEDYNKTKIDFDKVSNSLKDINKKSLQLNEDLAIKQKQKKQKEQELLNMNKKIQNSSQIIPILLKAQEQLQKSLKSIRSQLSYLIGNCILFCVTAVYLPLRRLSIKKKIIQASKKILRQNFISYSDYFIDQIINGKISTYEFSQNINNLIDLNVYLLKNITGVKIIVDPERKIYQNEQILQKNDLLNLIELQKQQQIPFQNEQLMKVNKIYYSAKDQLILSQKCLIIDWKITAIDQKERIFNKFAYVKKSQYFINKRQLKQKIHQNLQKIQIVKLNLYNRICEQKMKILDNDNFVEMGKQLVSLQQQTNQISIRAKKKTEQIKHLQQQISQQVQKIYIIYNIIKQIRPIGLDLFLQTCVKQGDPVQNAISWVLTNIHPQQRNGLLLVIAHNFDKLPHPDLLKQIIIQSPLKNTQFKIKKPSLVTIDNWQKVLQISNYSQHLKSMIQIVQKNQKQFQSWMNDYTYYLPKILQPQKLSFIEHMFIINHLKPKSFPQMIVPLINKTLYPYQPIPFQNKKVVMNSNYLTPIICNYSLDGINKFAYQNNKGRIKYKRIASLNSQYLIKKNVLKYMEQSQWLCLYGLLQLIDLNMLQKIIYQIKNYQKHQTFRIFILNQNSSNDLLTKSKYLMSISVFIYQQTPKINQLINYFNIQSDFINDNIQKEEQNNVKYRNRKYSYTKKQLNYTNNNNNINNQIQLLKQKYEDQNVINNNSITSIKKQKYHLKRFYKHLFIVHSVLINKYQYLKTRNYSILQRVLKTLKYTDQKSIPVQFNVQHIVSYIYKLYQFGIQLQQRKRIHGIIQRVIDQLKFTQKNIYGVNINNFPHIDKQVQNNYHIIGADQSITNRIAKYNLQFTLQTLDLIVNPHDITEQLEYIKNVFNRVPILLKQKQIKNVNYVYIYQKQQNLHNQKLKNVYEMIQWVNNYNNKQLNEQQTQSKNKYNMNNLLQKTKKLIGYNFPRNQFRNIISYYSQQLKKAHDFLLYFNPSLLSFVINPCLIQNIDQFISTYLINYYCKNQIKDAYNYTANIQFRKISNDSELAGIQGIIFKNIYVRDFRYNFQHKIIQPLMNQIDGEEKASTIIFKIKKNIHTNKQQQLLQLKIPLIHKKYSYQNNQQILTYFQFISNSIYPEYFMRNNAFIIE